MSHVSRSERFTDHALAALGLLLSLLLVGCAAPSSMAPDYPGGPMASDSDGSYEAAGAEAMPEEAMAEPMPAPAPVAPSAALGGASPAAAPVQAPGGGAESPTAGSPIGAPHAGPDPRAPVDGSPADGEGQSSDRRGAKQADPATPKPAPLRPSVAQMLIYTAELALQVEQGAFSSTIDRMVDLSISMGGYVASHDNTTIQVRVPSARFRDALQQFEALGVVVSRSVSAQDVSEEFNDLEIRLKSLKATRDRLEQFLTRAKDIQEVLAVERELTRVNGEIDRIEGRMRFLAARAAFSTITVRLQPKPTTVVIDDPNRPAGPPPPPRTIPLPVPWLPSVGLDRLLQLD